jgi:hypothetical protein
VPPRKIDSRHRNILGPILAAHRREKKLTQEECAELCAREGWDIDWQTIKKIENRERQILDFELIKLGRVLGIDIGQLLDGVQDAALARHFPPPADR